MVKCEFADPDRISPFLNYVCCSIQPWLQAEEVKSAVPQQNLQSVDDRAKLDGWSTLS